MSSPKIAVKRHKKEERRRYLRLNVYRGFIFHRLQNKVPAEKEESLINDVSFKGLSFDTPNLINRGDVLECEIYLPLDNQKIQLFLSVFKLK